MSASADIQEAIAPLIEAGLSVPIPVLRLRPKEIISDIEMAIASHGICIQILPPLPTKFMQGNSFIFFEGAEIRVRVWEYPQLNNTNLDGYEAVDEICLALHWAMPLKDSVAILAHPLQLAARPVEMADDPDKRIFEVIFEAQYQLG
jgi:hypothetical protein